MGRRISPGRRRGGALEHVYDGQAGTGIPKGIERSIFNLGGFNIHGEEVYAKKAVDNQDVSGMRV